MHPIINKLAMWRKLCGVERILIVGGLVSWVGLGNGLLYYLIFLLAMGVLIFRGLLLPKRWKVVAGIFLITPFFWIPALSFGAGTVEYFRGEARWYEEVGPEGDPLRRILEEYPLEEVNPHRASRVHVNRYRGSCLTVPIPFTDSAHNFAIATWTLLFGYMEGAYLGPYPEFQEAYEQLLNSEKRVAIDKFQSPGTREKLGINSFLAKTLRESVWPSYRYPHIRYAHVTEGFLLLASEDLSIRWGIFLVDLEQQKIIAVMGSRYLSLTQDTYAAFPNSLER